MRFFVTGATGFIGQHLCATLKSSGHYVLASGQRNKGGPWNDFIEWDIGKTAPPPDNKLQVDVFLHLASKAHALNEIGEDPNEYHSINVVGTQNALDLAQKIGVRRFVYFSSVKAMGEGNADYTSTAPIDESFPCLPAGAYGKSKLEAEGLIFAARHRIEAVAIRPCLVYGPDSKGNLAKMAEAIRKNRFPPIPEFANRRSVVHVDDLCRLALAAATQEQAKSGVFIAAEPQAYSTREMYELMLKALDRKSPRWSIPRPILSALGLGGDLIGKLRGKRFVFDSDALRKLSESAHYDGSKAANLLGFQYQNALGPSLIDILKPQ